MKSKKLLLFVESLPTENKNCFFESELPFLEKKFDEIVIIPLYFNNDHIIRETSVIKVLRLDYFVSYNRLKIFLSNFRLILRVFCNEFLKSKHRLKYCTHFFKNLNVLLMHIANAEYMKVKLQKYLTSDYLMYTYWFMQHTFSLLLLRTMYPFNFKIISRVHGKDWDEERLDYFPFRYWQYSQIDKIIPISECAKDYIITNFKIESNKFFVSKLGVHQGDKLSPVDADQLHIVSCSGLIPLKRVAFIAEVVSKISIPVKWTHFGDGKERKNVEDVIKSFKSDQNGILMGHVPNETYINFISNNPVSLFINWSTSEGIPVSVMETIGLGIPVIAPNVGGVSEIVNSITGFLIKDTNSTVNDIASLIEKLHQQKDIYNAEKRLQIKEFAHTAFSDEVNYSNFSNTISAF